MGFLSGAISGLGNIFHGIGNFFDGNEDQQKKQQQQAQQQAPQKVAPQPSQNNAPQPAQPSQPTPSLNLFQGAASQLQKANPSPSQMQAASDIATNAGIGPLAKAPLPTPQATQVNPIIPAAKAIAAPILGPLHSLNTNPLLVKAVNSVAGSAVQKPDSTLSSPVMPTSLTQAAGNSLGNIDPQIGELLNPGSYARGGAEVANSVINFAKTVPGMLSKGAKAAPGVEGIVNDALDIPTYLRQGLAGITPSSPYDVPTFQRNNADQAVQVAQNKISAIDDALSKVKPNNQATRAAAQQELKTAMASSPQEGAAVLRKQLLQKAAAGNDPVGTATAGFAPLRAQAVSDLADAQDAQEAANMIAPGVKSTNPTKIADATAAHVESLPDEAIAPPQASPTEPVVPTAMHPDEQIALKGMNDAAKTRVLTKDEQDAQAALQAKQDAIQTINAPIPEAATTGTPSGAAASTTQPLPESPPPITTPETATPPVEKSLPNDSTRTAPNAPNLRPGLDKKLSDVAKTAGKSTTHPVFSNPEVAAAAKAVVDDTPNSELLAKYSGVPKLQDTADLAHAHQSMFKLEAMAEAAAKSGDKEGEVAAKQAIDNIMAGAEQKTSENARGLNYTQHMYDTLPKQAKVSMAIRQIDKQRVAYNALHANKQMPLLKDDVAAQNSVEAALNEHLGNIEDTTQKIAANHDAQAELAKTVEPGKGASPEAIAKARSLSDEESGLQLKKQVQNREAARYFQGQTPPKAILQKLADYAKTSMLTNPASRANNVLNVGSNSVYELERSLGQGLLGKASNVLTKSNAATSSSLLRPGALLRGAKQGAAKVGAEWSGGLVKNLQKGLDKTKSDTNYQLVRTANDTSLGNKITNKVSALVKAPSNVIGGAMKQSELERIAEQEGKQAGYKGSDLKVYTTLRASKPTDAMAQKGDELQAQVSHMNDNKLARIVGATFKDTQANGNAKGGLELVKNAIMPFAKYPATAIWNQITDRNVIADSVHLIKGLKNGDIDGITKAVAGGGTDLLKMAIGYHLTQTGLITNKDANGYSDGGAYLHFTAPGIGDRYIPIGDFGVNAVSLLAGNAFANAQKSGGDMATNIAKTLADTTGHLIEAAGGQSLTGSNTALTDTQKAFNPNSGVNFSDAAASLGAQGVGQFIPGAFSFANSILNHSPLNPTGEAADTKVTKGSQGINTASGSPSTAKDIIPSLLKSEQNRIPFASQQLPRKAGVAAPDMLDEATRGSHSSQAQLDTAAKAKTAADLAASNKANGIPDPNAKYKAGDSFANSLETTIEKGNYDQAKAGLQQKLDKLNADPTTPETVKKPVETQMKQLDVLKAGKFDPSIRGLYSKTSLSEWRNMGDPTNDAYDPATYNKLYEYDTSLAKAGISANTTSTSDAKYSPKAPSKSSSNAAATLAKSNTLGSVPGIPAFSFGKLAPTKITTAAAIPTIQKLDPSTLKKRTISVSKAV